MKFILSVLSIGFVLTGNFAFAESACVGVGDQEAETLIFHPLENHRLSAYLTFSAPKEKVVFGASIENKDTGTFLTKVTYSIFSMDGDGELTLISKSLPSRLCGRAGCVRNSFTAVLNYKGAEHHFTCDEIDL